MTEVQTMKPIQCAINKCNNEVTLFVALDQSNDGDKWFGTNYDNACASDKSEDSKENKTSPTSAQKKSTTKFEQVATNDDMIDTNRNIAGTSDNSDGSVDTDTSTMRTK